MGMLFTFLCPGCGYEVQSAGGDNVLMRCHMTTIVCRTCKDVQDVVTHSEELGNFPPDESDEDGALLKCEVGPTHKVARWAENHRCPKCGKGMDRTDENMLCID